MILMNLNELPSLKSGKNRLLGIDLGDKTIGLSLSDLTWLIATPLETIRRAKLENDFLQLIKIIQLHHVAAVIIGLPINMNGTEGPQAQKVRHFIQQLQERLEIPVLLWDERLSTTAVTRTLLEADMSRKRRSQVVDKMAASFILQGVLDALR
jgi:putative holliday junction resolvase